MFEKEINKLANLLDDAGIPYEMEELWGGWLLCYPAKENRESDVICHKYSYGHEEGLLEMMGLTECFSMLIAQHIYIIRNIIK